MKNFKILVIAPHQDDETIGCGGTIAKLIHKGHQVCVLHVFEGCTNFLDHGAEETINARTKEVKQCADTLGFELLDNLGFKDRTFPPTDQLVSRLIQVFHLHKPNMVLVPHEGESDKEHQLVNFACTEALWLSKIPDFKGAVDYNKVNSALIGYEVWTPITKPNLIVDISEFSEIKRQAIRTFKSQLINNDWEEGSLGLNAYRAVTHTGKGHAEAFMFYQLAEDQLSIIGQTFN